MNHWIWLKGLFFMFAIWGAWAFLDRPILMATRRPSSMATDESLPSAIQSCAQIGLEKFPALGSSLLSRRPGIYEDHKTFSRRLRVVWSAPESTWKLQQPAPSDGTQSDWRTVAKFWDVDGDVYPDEAALYLDPDKAIAWHKADSSLDWNFFRRLKRDGNSWVWNAHLKRDDWSPAGNCYAWANPVVVFVNWAVMNHHWSPTLAFPEDRIEKKPASQSGD